MHESLCGQVLRFAVEYAEEIDNSSSEFLRSVKNAAEQSGLSTTYVQERIAEVNKENNITTSKNTTTLFNEDFAKKYPILSRTYNNVTRPTTTTTTTTTTVPSLSTGGTNPSASSQSSADSEKPETFSDQLEKLDNGLIYATDIAGHVSNNTGLAMQMEGSAWGKGGNAAGLISDGKAYSNAIWALIGVSGVISTYKAYKTYQETGDVGAATKVMPNWALSTSCSVLLEEGFMALAGPSLVALTAACPPAGIILTIASVFSVAKAGSEIGSTSATVRIDKGNLVEYDTHEKLMELNGLNAYLYNQQQRGAVDG